LIEHGFTSAPTQYRLYGRRFLQVWWPNQQILRGQYFDNSSKCYISNRLKQALNSSW